MAASFRFLLPLLCLPVLALAADDPRVMRLEQDVRNLQREVQVLSRQIEQLRLQSTRPGGEVRQSPAPVMASDAPGWLDASKWKRVKPGMPEFEVISLLGPPTSTREKGGARELLYALEVGTSAFLGGSVVLRDGKVVEAHLPTLK
jgi:hypothetical protein